jgi:ABC-type transport system involved in cytochrome bd biosynthesis fused ATPase/permease subunit
LLDDPLSAVDVHTEDLLVERLLFGRLQRATRIVVTHRLTHLERFDRVLFLVHGRLVADGHFRELMQTSSELRAFAASSALREALPEHAPEAPPASSSTRAQAGSAAGRVTEDEDRATGAVRWPVYR